MSISADPRWHASRQPWEVADAEERKPVRMSIALSEGKVKYDYAINNLNRLVRVLAFHSLFPLIHSKQEINKKPDSTIVEACIRGVIGNVDATSESLVVFHLPSEIDNVGFG